LEPDGVYLFGGLDLGECGDVRDSFVPVFFYCGFDVFFKIINWDAVEENYLEALKKFEK
jgi:hypothetical protein